MNKAVRDGIRATIAHLAIPIDQVREHPANPNHGDMAAITESLRLHGQYVPIVFNRRPGVASSGCLVKGNHTYRAMRELGHTSIAAVPVDVDDDQALRILIADNRTSDLHTPDDAALAGLLTDLGDLAGTGYDAQALADLVAALKIDAAPTVEDVEPEFDRAEELRQQYGVELGQLWQLGEHRLLCGDSTDAACVVRLMGTERFRVMWTDPPYGVSYADKNRFLNEITTGHRIQKPIEQDHMSEEQTEALLRAAFTLAVGYGLAGASCYVAAPAGPLHRRFIDALDASGFTYKHQLIWVKQQFVLGRSDYHYRHEPILYGWIENGAHYFVDDHTHDSVFEVDKPHVSNLHPTTKPLELVCPMLENSSMSGEMVYEPFSGSGTTILACEQLGRRCRAVELDPGYVAVAIHRWEQATGKTATRLS